MQVLETTNWSLLLPPEWLGERDDDGIIIGDRDEVGCIEISELRRDEGDFESADLQQFTDGAGPWTALRRGSFQGVVRSFEEEDAALREWYLFAGDVLLYITYSCEVENRGLDDAAVDDILDTLRYSPD